MHAHLFFSFRVGERKKSAKDERERPTFHAALRALYFSAREIKSKVAVIQRRQERESKEGGVGVENVSLRRGGGEEERERLLLRTSRTKKWRKKCLPSMPGMGNNDWRTRRRSSTFSLSIPRERLCANSGGTLSFFSKWEHERCRRR